MAIQVRALNEEITIRLSHAGETVEFIINQLDYRTKSHITGLVTQVNQGEVTIDSALTCFYNLKYGLKKIKGITGTDGSTYKLEFETPDKKALTDKCVDELLSTEISDHIIYAAHGLSKARYPDVVLHPLTNLPLQGVEVIPSSELKGTKKK